MMYTMPKNLLSICVNFTLATQRCKPEERAVPTAVGKRMDTKVSTLLNPASFAR